MITDGDLHFWGHRVGGRQRVRRVQRRSDGPRDSRSVRKDQRQSLPRDTLSTDASQRVAAD